MYVIIYVIIMLLFMVIGIYFCIDLYLSNLILPLFLYRDNGRYWKLAFLSPVLAAGEPEPVSLSEKLLAPFPFV